MDAKEIKKLISLMDEASLTEIEVEEGGKRVRLRREVKQIIVPHIGVTGESQPVPVIPETVEEGPHTLIRSPIVGTFYRSPSPEAEVYVELGHIVKKGQTLCIIEAMKLLNEIESDVDGKVAAICVEDGTPVEYGAPLFKIEPA